MADEHPRLSLFHALPITPAMVASAGSGALPPLIDDLVGGHLTSAGAPLPRLDKSLAGFFVLAEDAGGFTVLDVRGDGRVWRQDRATRRFRPVGAALDSWIAGGRRELGPVGEEDERGRHEPPSTAALAARLQWPAQLFARTSDRSGSLAGLTAAAGRAAERLRAVWPTAVAARVAFEAELPMLAADPHLAVYWLLHTTLLGLDAARAHTLAAVGPRPAPLVAAFAAALGALGDGDDVAAVPAFRARRSLIAQLGADADERERASLRAMRMAPHVLPLARALWVERGLARGRIGDDEVVRMLDGTTVTAGTQYLAAVLDRRAGRLTSVHADEFMRLAPSDAEHWDTVVRAAHDVHDLTTEAEGLTGLVRWALDRDDRDPRTLAMAVYARALAGRDGPVPDAELHAAIIDAGASTAVLAELAADPARRADIVDRCGPRLAVITAHRLLARCGLGREDPAAVGWAGATILAADPGGGETTVAHAIASLAERVAARSVGALATVIDAAGHPAAATLRTLLTGPDPVRPAVVEAALAALAPYAHQEPLVSTLLDRGAGRVGRADTRADAAIWSALFDPGEADTCVLHRLTGPQAVTVVEAMIGDVLAHPDPYVRAAAGRALRRFDHTGAEGRVIAALIGHGAGYADADGTDPESERRLAELVAALYGALHNMGTAVAQAAIIERLFTERRAYRPLGEAVAALPRAAAHRAVLAAFEERPDAHAAARYARVLHEAGRAFELTDLLDRLRARPVPATEEEVASLKAALALCLAAEGGDPAAVEDAAHLYRYLPGAPRLPGLDRWTAPAAVPADADDGDHAGVPTTAGPVGATAGGDAAEAVEAGGDGEDAEPAPHRRAA